jgi:hypothetical protein
VNVQVRYIQQKESEMVSHINRKKVKCSGDVHTRPSLTDFTSFW